MLLDPQPAAELARHAAGLDDGANAGAIDRLPGFGAIKINKVQPGRTVGNPARAICTGSPKTVSWA